MTTYDNYPLFSQEITWVSENILDLYKPKSTGSSSLPQSDVHFLEEPYFQDLALRASLLSRHFCASAYARSKKLAVLFDVKIGSFLK